MPENVENAMLEILKRIQADVSEVKTRLERLEPRLERLENEARKQRRNSAAMLVMMRGTVAIYEDRISDLEEDVRILQEQGG